MRRRAFLLSAAAAGLRADPRQEIYDLFGTMANSLAEGNAVPFLEPFDRGMPGYRDLAANVTALVEQAEVQSAIEIVREEGGAGEQKVDLDWMLQIIEKRSTANSVRRQQLVKCRLVKRGRSWRILSIEPIAFFAPPRFRD